MSFLKVLKSTNSCLREMQPLPGFPQLSCHLQALNPHSHFHIELVHIAQRHAGPDIFEGTPTDQSVSKTLTAAVLIIYGTITAFQLGVKNWGIVFLFHEIGSWRKRLSFQFCKVRLEGDSYPKKQPGMSLNPWWWSSLLLAIQAWNWIHKPPSIYYIVKIPRQHYVGCWCCLCSLENLQ